MEFSLQISNFAWLMLKIDRISIIEKEKIVMGEDRVENDGGRGRGKNLPRLKIIFECP